MNKIRVRAQRHPQAGQLERVMGLFWWPVCDLPALQHRPLVSLHVVDQGQKDCGTHQKLGRRERNGVREMQSDSKSTCVARPATHLQSHAFACVVLGLRCPPQVRAHVLGHLTHGGRGSCQTTRGECKRPSLFYILGCWSS